ncbi:MULTISPECIES: hypothetical protein [unclassified Azospirillum]|uniref:hypothetical protein n=1 Tax=unclassified Azospirillum TaxID=2630922 RepID=UPI0011B1F436|nr:MULTISPECIES: hypothetical protein [unclassified Azospirillum]
MDKDCIPTLIKHGNSPTELAKAQAEARKHLPGFPTNGCAANLSALLQGAGIAVPMTLGAGHLATIIKERGWERIAVGQQQAGDIGVTYDLDPTPPGADHIYLVVGVSKIGADEMRIADNQAKTVHTRHASGQEKTPTEYFLRAPGYTPPPILIS